MDCHPTHDELARLDAELAELKVAYPEAVTDEERDRLAQRTNELGLRKGEILASRKMSPTELEADLKRTQAKAKRVQRGADGGLVVGVAGWRRTAAQAHPGASTGARAP